MAGEQTLALILILKGKRRPSQPTKDESGIEFIPREVLRAGFRTGGRALDTEYQNTRGRPILVYITCQFGIVDGGTCYLEGFIGATSPAASIFQGMGYWNTAGATWDSRHGMAIVVPPGWYYRTVAATGGGLCTLTLYRWNEVDL